MSSIWAGALIAIIEWLFGVVAVTYALSHRRDVQAARRTLAFVNWARWTSLVVVARDGTVHADTLYGMYTDGVTDRVWAHPVSTSLWFANPDTILGREIRDLD